MVICISCVRKKTLDRMTFFLLITNIAIIRSLMCSVHWIFRFHFLFKSIPTPCLPLNLQRPCFGDHSETPIFLFSLASTFHKEESHPYVHPSISLRSSSNLSLLCNDREFHRQSQMNSN